MRRPLLPVLLAALVALPLSGCSEGASGTEASDGPDVPDLGLVATSTTGVIRGVVVDEAIRPLANAVVQVSGGGVAANRTTSEDGFFGFDGLAPGTYFLSASKLGFVSAQTSTEVVAGVAEPRAVKLQMAADPFNRPYATQHKWEGFLQCGLSVIALCGVGTGLPMLGNVTGDRFATTVAVDGVPLLVQSEAVWDTTTAASDQLWLWHSSASKDDGGFNGTRNAYAWRQGPSPLIMTSNATEVEDSRFGTDNDLYLRMFTGSIQGTRNPTDPQGCYPGGPGPDTYCGGVGFSLNQVFEVYTTQFFGYLPPEGWTFVGTSLVPQPA